MTAPVKYGEHERPPAGVPCSICGTTHMRPYVDHCHRHGWVRGPVCGSCNITMTSFDRRIVTMETTRKGKVTTGQLIAHAARCPDCEAVTESDLSGTRAVQVRFTASEWEAIRERSKSEHRTISAYVRLICTKAIQEGDES